MSLRLLVSALLLVGVEVCSAADWQGEVGRRLDGLVEQLNDGCSSEVRDARKLYRFGKGENVLVAALISIEGQHCGNGNIEYLAVYRVGSTRPKDEDEVPLTTYWLSAFADIGGRGERFVDFESLKYADETFTMKALGYNHDAMCCPSVPLFLRYKFDSNRLSELQPGSSLDRTRESSGLAGTGTHMSIQTAATDPAPVTIYLFSDGTCEVRDTRLSCPEMPAYMRDVLKVGPDVKLSFIARGTPPYESVVALFEALGNAGFKGKFGFVNFRDSEKQ